MSEALKSKLSKRRTTVLLAPKITSNIIENKIQPTALSFDTPVKSMKSTNSSSSTTLPSSASTRTLTSSQKQDIALRRQQALDKLSVKKAIVQLAPDLNSMSTIDRLKFEIEQKTKMIEKLNSENLKHIEEVNNKMAETFINEKYIWLQFQLEIFF
jgi:hypothetical protein